MNTASVLRSIIRGEEPENASRTLSQLAEVVRRLLERDVSGANATLESVDDPESDVESFVLTIVRLRMAVDNGDLSLAEVCVEQLRNHPLMAEPIASAMANFRMGTYLRLRSQYDAALTHQLHASAIFRSEGWKYEEALCGNEIGSIQLLKGDMTGAVSSYLSIVDAIREFGGEASYAPLLANLATALHRSGNDVEAERRFREVLGMGPMKVPGTHRARTLLNIAVIAKSQKRYDEAETLYRDALSNLSLSTSPSLYAQAIVGLAEQEINRARYDVVRALMAEISDLPELSFQVGTKLQLHYINAYMKHVAGEVEDSIASVRLAIDLGLSGGLLEETHGVLKDTLMWAEDDGFRLELLECYRHVQDERIQSVSKGVNAIIDLRSRFEQERSRLEIDRQQELSRVIVDTQTRTMSEIGRELHDSIGQDLTVLMRLSERLVGESDIPPPERAQILSTMTVVSRRASSDARRIAHLLADGGISGRGLVEALSVMRDEITQAVPDLDLQVIVTGQLDEMPNASARALYRVIQTLLQNVIKHSGAHVCSINIVTHDDHYHLGVEDDGRGFDSGSIGGGMGLREMRARIELVGGNVRIESAPDRGTYIEVTIPRQERATE